MFKRRDNETVGRIDTLIGRSANVQGDIEFADEVTMWKAMEGRREI